MNFHREPGADLDFGFSLSCVESEGLKLDSLVFSAFRGLETSIPNYRTWTPILL